jgi:hypothetical protein
MSSKTAGERIAAHWIDRSEYDTAESLQWKRALLAEMIDITMDAAILRAVAADRRKREKKTKGAKR